MRKPPQRSRLRRQAGKLYYWSKKFLYRYLHGGPFATQQSSDRYPHTLFQHQSTLLRKLKNIDMRMQHHKVTNLRIALQSLHGLIIQPGETFSYRRQLGRITRSKWYLDGMILRDGKVLSGTGGGLCQLSNLLFRMTLHSPLTVVERRRHGYDVFPDVQRKQPFGSGATCAYPTIDLQIQNTTSQPFQFDLSLTDTHLVGRLLSDRPRDYTYEIIEKNHHITSERRGGHIRNNTLYRRITDLHTQETHDEFITHNHAIMMYNPLLEYGTTHEKN